MNGNIRREVEYHTPESVCRITGITRAECEQHFTSCDVYRTHGMIGGIRRKQYIPPQRNASGEVENITRRAVFRRGCGAYRGRSTRQGADGVVFNHADYIIAGIRNKYAPVRVNGNAARAAEKGGSRRAASVSRFAGCAGDC